MIDYAALAAAYKHYNAAITHRARELGKVDLPKLDRWFRALEPSPELSKDQVIDIVKWKHAYQTKRKRNLELVSGEGDSHIRAATRKAFHLLDEGDLDAALAVLIDSNSKSKIRGVGPATASAILATRSRAVPFMSDEAMAELLGRVDYNVSTYRALEAEVRAAARCEAWQDALREAGCASMPILEEALEKAFWALAHSARPPADRLGTKAAAAGKRPPEAQSGAAEGSSSKRLKTAEFVDAT